MSREPGAWQSPEVESFRELVGRGVSGEIRGREYEVRSWRGHGGGSVDREDTLTEIAVIRDGETLGRIRLGDRVREDSASVIERLRAMGMAIGVLSGDSPRPVAAIARKLGLTDNWRGGLTPEEKKAEVQRHPHALMVGDGANDANALAASYVGVAVHGGVEVSLQSSDVYCRKPGVSAIPSLLVIARETMRVIHRNFAFSLCLQRHWDRRRGVRKSDPAFCRDFNADQRRYCLSFFAGGYLQTAPRSPGDEPMNVVYILLPLALLLGLGFLYGFLRMVFQGQYRRA